MNDFSRTQQYIQFFTEVLKLNKLTNAPTEQHRIYYNQINLFLSHHALLSAAQVIDLLSTPTKPFTEQDLKNLVDTNKAFFVTAPNFAGYEGYPAFQFDIYKRRVKPILEPIIGQVSKYYFDWDIVLWLGSYFGDLNSSAIEAIDNPKQHSLLIQLARNIENECL